MDVLKGALRIVYTLTALCIFATYASALDSIMVSITIFLVVGIIHLQDISNILKNIILNETNSSSIDVKRILVSVALLQIGVKLLDFGSKIIRLGYAIAASGGGIALGILLTIIGLAIEILGVIIIWRGAIVISGGNIWLGVNWP